MCCPCFLIPDVVKCGYFLTSYVSLVSLYRFSLLEEVSKYSQLFFPSLSYLLKMIIMIINNNSQIQYVYCCLDYQTTFKPYHFGKLISFRNLHMKLNTCLNDCRTGFSNPCPEEPKMPGCISRGLLNTK